MPAQTPDPRCRAKRTYYVSRIDRAARPDSGCVTTWTVRRRVLTGGSVAVQACDTRAEARALAKHLNALRAREDADHQHRAGLRLIQGGEGAA